MLYYLCALLQWLLRKVVAKSMGHLLTVGTLPRCFEGDLGDSATILGRERGVALAPGTWVPGWAVL